MRAARRGVTANGSATAAAETAASRERSRLRLNRFERRFSTPSPRRANVAAAHPHEATSAAEPLPLPFGVTSRPRARDGKPRTPGNHASVWHVSQKALRVCLLGAMAGQRARAISNAARQDPPRDRGGFCFRAFEVPPAFSGSPSAAAHRDSPKAASASARHRSADSARARHSLETHAARASACGCRRSSTRPRTSPGRSPNVASLRAAPRVK